MTRLILIALLLMVPTSEFAAEPERMTVDEQIYTLKAKLDALELRIDKLEARMNR
jgi:hypothetical protein